MVYVPVRIRVPLKESSNDLTPIEMKDRDVFVILDHFIELISSYKCKQEGTARRNFAEL